MAGIDYHGCLNALGEACNAAQADIILIPNPLEGIRIGRFSPGSPVSLYLWKSGIFIRHLILVFRIWGSVRRRFILVREFSNIPMFLTGLLVLPLRKKLLLTVNHNLQWAVRSRLERAAFRLLDWLGFRFVFFETMDLDAVQVLKVNKKRHWVIPLPVTDNLETRPETENRAPHTVGIIGHYRSEKGIDSVLDVILESNPNYRLILGIPNMVFFRKNSRYGKNVSGFELRDTSSPDVYRATLKACDIIVLCYTPEGYMYRPSGIVADAASCGTAVLSPCYPVLKHQVSYPAAIGSVYSKKEEIPQCIQQMLDHIEEFKNAFAPYAYARNAAALAGLFDKLAADE